jgi:pimeloyl-ACP methyl ester carboxylesterase
MVLIGHSMGGLVARMAVINGNPELTQAIAPNLDSTKPIPDVIKRCVDFQPVKGIKRVIYVATPHHGVEMLDSFWLNQASSWLALPKISEDLAAAAGSTDEMTSIQTMRPGSRFLNWLSQQPIGLPVRAHSLIANINGTDPSGSDGMVTYSSAHIDGVASELIIQSNHGSIHKNSEGVRELRRILELHLVE